MRRSIARAIIATAMAVALNLNSCFTITTNLKQAEDSKPPVYARPAEASAADRDIINEISAEVDNIFSMLGYTFILQKEAGSPATRFEPDYSSQLPKLFLNTEKFEVVGQGVFNWIRTRNGKTGPYVRIYSEIPNDYVKAAIDSWKIFGLEVEFVKPDQNADITIYQTPKLTPYASGAIGLTATYMLFNSKTGQYLVKSSIDFNASFFSERRREDEFNMVLRHELGHALGIGTHSFNPNDMMFSSMISNLQQNEGKWSLGLNGQSSRDLKTMEMLYAIPPVFEASTDLKIASINRDMELALVNPAGLEGEFVAVKTFEEQIIACAN